MFTRQILDMLHRNVINIKKALVFIEGAITLFVHLNGFGWNHGILLYVTGPHLGVWARDYTLSKERIKQLYLPSINLISVIYHILK